MAKPIFRRFWVKIRPDGTAIPQFDPKDGKSREVGTDLVPLASLIFHPVTPILAERIKSNGDYAEPSDLPILSFDFLPGDKIEFNRVGSLRIDPVKVCGFCGAEFDWDSEECPRCLSRIKWYCPECDELKEPLIDTLIVSPEEVVRAIKIVPALQKWAWKIVEQLPGKWGFHDIQARCPDCEKNDPRGLLPVQCIASTGAERLYTYYDLRINGKLHRILDYRLSRN